MHVCIHSRDESQAKTVVAARFVSSVRCSRNLEGTRQVQVHVVHHLHPVRSVGAGCFGPDMRGRCTCVGEGAMVRSM